MLQGSEKKFNRTRTGSIIGMAIIFLGSAVIILIASSFREQEEYFRIAKERTLKYDPKNKDLVIVVDYRKNILRERLYVLDMRTGKKVISSRVSHSINSGILYANRYSNVPRSYISSKGNFMTGEPYHGKLGYCMRINGLDKGVNENTRSRAIVFHSTRPPYLWSAGCFATLPHINRRIIDITKNGTLVCVIDR